MTLNTPMKVVLLAGGLGTRIAEKSDHCPKPMVEIGGKPILWHIMNIYASWGHKEFVVALGYKGEIIKEYFSNFYKLNNSLCIDLGTGESSMYGGCPIDWKVHLIDTGASTQTGSRIKRLKPWIGKETFMATYGDGVCDIDIDALISFHKSHGKLATLAAVRPPARFGALEIEESSVRAFSEKPQTGEGWINGGFFVLEPEIFDYIDSLDDTIWEKAPLEKLASEGELMAFEHPGFWHPMDTLRDQRHLQSLWESELAPWKVWEENAHASLVEAL